ncbi:hypothetical protein E3226_000330 [Legionella geestiana]|uniref:hypothetical protein n=1 Tax=Legionella geestiana TaxID=45065 RepID=UPI00109273C5|nr:hypothetical protein [Legionella geestiana]QDQ38958.1 hypothetical protein E3226_000330 [Legionella geestiana]
MEYSKLVHPGIKGAMTALLLLMLPQSEAATIVYDNGSAPRQMQVAWHGGGWHGGGWHGGGWNRGWHGNGWNRGWNRGWGGRGFYYNNYYPAVIGAGLIGAAVYNPYYYGVNCKKVCWRTGYRGQYINCQRRCW